MEPDPSAPRRLEAYLDQILAPLARRLSPFHRDELRRELRVHLWSRIEAYMELGHSEDEAVTEALRQFGGAEDFLRQWQQEWIKMTPQATLREMWTATRCALLLSIPALLITCLVSPQWSPQHTYGWGPQWIGIWFGYVTTGWSSFVLDFVILPIALGVAVGRLTPNYAGVGILAALAMEVFLTYWPEMGLIRFNLGDIGRELTDQVFICSTSWLPLACTTALLTGWWAGRSKSRRLGQEIESGRLHGT